MLTQFWHLCRSGGRPMAARLNRWRAQARTIIRRAETLRHKTDDELFAEAQSLRWRARAGTPLSQLLEETYALVREATRREMGIEQYVVQLIGGIALFEGGLAEMQTGEGKTLTGIFPAALYALAGRGCHVVTVNDYLASRDAEHLAPIFKRLNLTVGMIQSESTPEDRRKAYHQDLTYATSREFGFDFLRDRIAAGDQEAQRSTPRVFGDTQPIEGVVQRGHFCAIIDEADSVLLDDAVTPLVIGVELPPTESSVTLLQWCRALLPHLKLDEDFLLKPDRRQAELTIAGCRRVMTWPKPRGCRGVDAEKLYRRVEEALRAEFLYAQGRDYVVQKDEVVIVDESTGRTLPGRKWQEGLHQAVECHAGVKITAETGEAARITVQSFFRRYRHLAGMTGTAMTAAREFRRTYRMTVTRVPTHRPSRRQALPPRMFISLQAKWRAVVAETHRLRDAGRAVLIGTPSVAASQALSQLLTEEGLLHRTLNAHFFEEEAAIVAEAGQPMRVTIATNMAGRGTDIKLHPEVAASGGLHVIATEMHSSVRIDRQLIGRAARQGDPGSYQFFLSLEDELFRSSSPQQRARWQAEAAALQTDELPGSWLRLFRRTQSQLERRSKKSRQQMLRQEKERERTAQRLGLDPYLELVN